MAISSDATRVGRVRVKHELTQEPVFIRLHPIASGFISLSRWLLDDPPKYWKRLRPSLNGIQEVTDSD